MSYNIKYDEITSLQQSTQTTISAWGDGITSIQTALSALIGDSRLQGQTASSIKSYLSEVHGTLLQTLQSLMNDYSASLLLYKDGYYQIDSNSHAQLPGQVFKTLQSELRLSQAHLKDQLELLQNTRAKLSDLVHYSGVSHAKTVVDYSELITDIHRLDEAIIQYESNHASQDLAAFKELLASTKALIAEYSSKPKRAGSYQVGDIGQLNTIKRFATAYQGVARHLETNAKRLQAAQERDHARFEAVAAEDRAKQGWIDLALSLVTIAVGVAAIVMTAGAATPLVVGAFVVGSGTVAYGASNLYEAGHNIYLGSVGDGLTVATNPLRDTLFMGNDRLYHQIGGLFTTASAALILIGQTKSVAKGLTEFTIGEVGGFIGGQASYHGTKLLGGSEQDAQRATLVGNILAGYAASSAARRFSLNEPIAARVTKPTYNHQQLLKNLENSRLARESSNFGGYIKKESVTKYPTQIDSKVTVGAKENLPGWIADSFTDSHYRTVITGEEITLYRTFGGASDAGGGFVTTVPATNRIQAKIDTALLPEWKNTRQYEAVIKIPKGSQLNIGKVAPQTVKSSGTTLIGGGDQVLLPNRWPLEWIQEIRIVPN